MEPLLRDPALQDSFEKNGFVKIPGIDEEAVSKLLDYYEQLGMVDELGYGFHISLDKNDQSQVAEVIDTIIESAAPQLENHFTNARPYIASFVIKEPNPKGVVPIHQDWTFVDDEKRHCSATVWIPLVDVDEDNGALGVVKGSHEFFRNVRPSPSPAVKNPWDEHMFSIFPYIQIVPMRAGEALVFNNRTFHASPPNTTTSSRVAVGLGFTQSAARLVHYFMNPADDTKMVKYKVDESFFKKYNNNHLQELFTSGQSPADFEVEEIVPYNPPSIATDKLVEMIKNNGNEFNISLVEKLARLFNYNVDGTKKEDVVEEPVVEVEAPQPVVEEQIEVTSKPFWKVYTPLNILREIRFRILGS